MRRRLKILGRKNFFRGDFDMSEDKVRVPSSISLEVCDNGYYLDWYDGKESHMLFFDTKEKAIEHLKTMELQKPAQFLVE
jgi:hypothetical protein